MKKIIFLGTFVFSTVINVLGQNKLNIDSIIITNKTCYGEAIEKFHHIQIISPEDINKNTAKGLLKTLEKEYKIRNFIDSLENEIVNPHYS